MTSYYTDTLYPLQDKVLSAIDDLSTSFYLTGGTALSRGYFSHRYSDDLDLFVNQDPEFTSSSERILSELSTKIGTEVITRSKSYYSLMLEKILRVELVNDVAFHHGQIQELPIFSRVDNVDNILSNKLSALISRDEPKDVVDVWIIAKNRPIDWPEIFQAAGSKAAGIFAPDVAQKLVSLPLELLETIKWVEGKRPSVQSFKKDLEKICNDILKVPQPV